MAKRKARRARKIILAVTAVILVAALGLGIWYFTLGKPKDPVKVYSFNYLGMTEYWGDNQESYGPVTTDRIQTVYISETQTVTQVHVEQGAQVKKGLSVTGSQAANSVGSVRKWLAANGLM